MTTRLAGATHSAHPKSSGSSYDEKIKLTSASLNDEKVSVRAPLATPLGTGEATDLGLLQYWRQSIRDLDAIATQPSVFDDPVTLEAYRPPPTYENIHRFNPDARWTYREEKKIIRKIDWRIALWACIMFFSLDLDRSNISQANSDNFLDDLGLTTNDFNLGNTLFRFSFLLAELPSQLISKRVGPDVWIPTQMVLWSTVSFSQFWLKGRASFLTCRFLLGFMEGGFIPDVVLYLSYFYTKSELPIRLAFFWISNYVSDIVSAFLATGILQLRGVNGKEGWRYLFLIEGLITLSVGLSSWFLMPAGPTQTRTWFRPNGWFSEREETIMVNRVLRDDPTKSSMHNREGLSLKMIFEALRDWRMWPIYVLGIVHMMPVGPPQTYLTLSLRNLGFNTTETNLLTIPSTIIGMIMLLFTAYLSEIVNSRVAATVILQVWALPLLVALYTFDQHTSQWVYFAVVTLVTGFPYVHPIQVAWASRNSYSVQTRTISASVYNMFVQAGAIIYANIYKTDDKVYPITIGRTNLNVLKSPPLKPLCGYLVQQCCHVMNLLLPDKRGNRTLIAITSMNIVLYVLTFFFYRMLNSRREKIWSSWTEKEQKEYVETTTDAGNKRMDFRFAY